ncbi:MAG: carboxypeptidase-like regulatory domain-containing protein [Acidobacteriota bacterium]
MKLTRILVCTLAVCMLLTAALAQAATVSGTVTNKTTGKPAAGDTVALLDVQANMGEAAHATTDASGHYTLNLPGAGPYLIRVTHQGAGYFIAAPQGGGQGDIPVYDVAAKVKGVFIEADVIEAEATNGQLQIDERYFVHNTSSPPTTQWSPKSFSIVLPADASVADVGAQRPNGLPTSVKLDPDGPKGHYSFNFPIQPDDGDKDTMFQISYTLPYTSGSYSFKAQETMAAQNVAVLLPKTMNLAGAAGASFDEVNADPGVQTFLAKNVPADKSISFTISGTGQIPREAQAGAQSGGQATDATASTPGGGIGTPIDTPDPLSKYKWWILGALALLLAAAAAFLLRKPEMAVAGAPGVSVPGGAAPSRIAAPLAPAAPAARNAALLSALKDELFALESEKLSGTISPVEYGEAKAALETVLKRALRKN